MNRETSQPHSIFPTELLSRIGKQHRRKLIIAKYTLVFVLGIFVAWFLGGGRASSPAGNGVELSVAGAEADGPTLWTCSMHPQIRSSKPGKCPLCGMDLVPVAKSGGGMRTLAISSESKALMMIETSPVERRFVMHEIPMVGRVDYDETKLGYITAWVPGRLDRLYVDYTGVEVKKGDHLVSIYSEQLYSAQEELIQALRYRSERTTTNTTRVRSIDLVESAREKLRLLGLKDEQIAEIEKRTQPVDRMTIYAPLGGIVIDKLKQQGERVQLGERIYTIADLSQVWVHLDAYESDLPWVRYGQDVTITTDAYPGGEFHGRIAFIQPVLNDKTRTVKVRVNVPNLAGKLKPEMFVHGVVRPRVAAGGKVMDPSLAGKWISPMHPEIVKDEPGACDICGMPLVRAESLGYVAPETDTVKPLVVPYSAALVTGTRAIVYVQVPTMPSAAEPAFQALSVVIQVGDVEKIRAAFVTYANMLDQPYDQPGTDYARRLWNTYADRLARHALSGQRATSAKEAEQVFAKIETTMNEAREQFAPPDQPTYEGREIVLGPRAGDYYLVAHGLEEGELVVTQGNFKIDAEIQIQAKPSMMTPEGGGGAAAKQSGDEHAGPKMILPAEFHDQLRDLDAAYQQVTKAINEADLKPINAAFSQLSQALGAVDGASLTGRPRMVWKEYAMLLGNDAFEGSAAKQLQVADRVYLELKGHMRRLRDQLGAQQEQQRVVERIEVPPEFQAQLARLWQAYLQIQQALAGDDAGAARQGLTLLRSAWAALDDGSLSDDARRAWGREHKNLTKILNKLEAADEINAFRAEFSLLSEELSVLVKSFGFGGVGPVYQLHCPMAFDNRGAIWFQDNDKAKNPYFGSTMLGCADRVEQVAPIVEPTKPDEHQGHEGHKH